jgi:hypothetical protein
VVIKTREQETWDQTGREIIEKRHRIRDKNSENRTEWILDRIQ